MTDSPDTSPPAVPPDDPQRTLAVARPDEDASLAHIGLVGDTYTILLSGKDTAGRYTLIDMHVPPGGGPPPHRHDFEEMFTVLDGEVELTFRGERMVARAGETVNVPANAPHAFTNASGQAGAAAVHVLTVRPGGVLPRGRGSGGHPDRAAAQARRAAQAAFIAKSQALAPQYRTELLPPPGGPR